MSQTDYARRRQCVPPPSVKGRRSVFPRRIAGEAVFFTVFKTDPEKNTSTKTSAPFTIKYELPRNSRVGVDCQLLCSFCYHRGRSRNSRVGIIPLPFYHHIKKAQPHAKVVLFFLPPY